MTQSTTGTGGFGSVARPTKERCDVGTLYSDERCSNEEGSIIVRAMRIRSQGRGWSGRVGWRLK